MNEETIPANSIIADIAGLFDRTATPALTSNPAAASRKLSVILIENPPPLGNS